MTVETRSALRHASVIVFLGVVIALCAWIYLRAQSPTIEDFKREYAVGDVLHQQAVAEKYMQLFPIEELLQAIEDANAEKNCHSEGHGIGRALYKADPNFASVIRTCGHTCTDGCFHGALMQMFVTGSDTLGGAIEGESRDTDLQQIRDEALTLCDRPEVASEVRPQYCAHGLGHIFAYFAPNDVGAAIRSCELLRHGYDIESCTSGAFMEYLFTASTSARYAYRGEAPCDQFPSHKRACYMYKAYVWLRAWPTPDAALGACDTFGGDADLCIYMTAQAISNKQILRSKAETEAICRSFSGDRYRNCIRGALQKIVGLNNGDDSPHLCDDVHPAYFDECLSVQREYVTKVEYGR